MQRDEYPALANEANDQRPDISAYPGIAANLSLDNDVPKEQPQSALSILLWGNRSKRRQREAERQNPAQPEWFQAFFVIWVSVFVLAINIGSYSLWVFGLQLLLYIALLRAQTQRREPNRVPLHPNEMSAWLLLISYGIVIIPPLFLHGYLWRLPVLASYCLLQLWLMESGGYTRELPKQPKQQSSKLSSSQKLLINIGVIVAYLGIIFVAVVGWGTIWPFVAYCLAFLGLIIFTRPKGAQSSSVPVAMNEAEG